MPSAISTITLRASSAGKSAAVRSNDRAMGGFLGLECDRVPFESTGCCPAGVPNSVSSQSCSPLNEFRLMAINAQTQLNPGMPYKLARDSERREVATLFCVCPPRMHSCCWHRRQTRCVFASASTEASSRCACTALVVTSKHTTSANRP